LPNDPDVEDAQGLAPSCPSEKEHGDGDRAQNNSACEIHGSSVYSNLNLVREYNDRFA
jgi:hypothetical protein